MVLRVAPQLGAVVVVGGGRWGRILVRQLLQDDLAAQVTLVTRHGYTNCLQWRSRLPVDTRRRLKLSCELADLTITPQAGIVATRPAQHYAAARALLEQRVHTLVEKPFVREEYQERELAATAERGNLLLGVNHEYLVAPWLAELKKASNGDRAVRVRIAWRERRRSWHFGEQRLRDDTVTTEEDLFPHLFSILSRLFGVSAPLILRATRCLKSDGIRAFLRWRGVDVACDVHRDAPSTLR